MIWHPPPSSSGQGTVLVDIGNDDQEWTSVEEEMQSTVRYTPPPFIDSLNIF